MEVVISAATLETLLGGFFEGAGKVATGILNDPGAVCTEGGWMATTVIVDSLCSQCGNDGSVSSPRQERRRVRVVEETESLGGQRLDTLLGSPDDK